MKPLSVKNQAQAVVFAAILGFIGLFVTGVFVYLAAIDPKKLEIAATQTAEEKQTEKAKGTEPPSPSPVITPTSSIIPTITSVPRTHKIVWPEPDRIMVIQFYRDGKLIHDKFKGGKSGVVDLTWAPPGELVIKLWVPGASNPENIYPVIVASPSTCAEAKFTEPNGFRDSNPDPIYLQDFPKMSTKIKWVPERCEMFISVLQNGSEIDPYTTKMKSGDVGLEWINNLGQTEIKIWDPDAPAAPPGSEAFPADAMQINVVDK